MTLPSVAVQIIAGDDQTINMTVYDENNAVANLTGYTNFVMYIKGRPQDDDALAVMTIPGTVTDPTTGTASFTFLPTDTADNAGAYHYAVRYLDPTGKKYTAAAGMFLITPT